MRVKANCKKSFWIRKTSNIQLPYLINLNNSCSLVNLLILRHQICQMSEALHRWHVWGPDTQKCFPESRGTFSQHEKEWCEKQRGRLSPCDWFPENDSYHFMPRLSTSSAPLFPPVSIPIIFTHNCFFELEWTWAISVLTSASVQTNMFLLRNERIDVYKHSRITEVLGNSFTQIPRCWARTIYKAKF